MSNETDITDFATVVGVGPDSIQIEITSTEEYKRCVKDQLQIGSYLRIADDNDTAVISIVQSFRIRDRVSAQDTDEPAEPVFVLETQPVGRIESGTFRRGGKHITIPPKHVSIASGKILAGIYESTPANKRLSFGTLAQDEDVRVVVDGDKFFGKHIGVVGSTGSGKSCTVAAVIQAGIAANAHQTEAGVLNNSHVIIFDLHGEYGEAFPESARRIGVEDLRLPYWLMNSEELEEMFIESREQNSHNQISQFRNAVIENKAMHAGGGVTKPSYDSPVYFSLVEVINYLSNLNSEVVGKSEGENCPKLATGDLIGDRSSRYFSERLQFVETSTAGGRKASNGAFNGEFNRFLMRLEARQTDKRLSFLLDPRNADGDEYKTDDLREIIEQFTGYGDDQKNVTILDLSGVPFEVLSIVVSLVTRLIFTFAFHLRRTRPVSEGEIPFLLVFEEAHNYVPQSQGARFTSVKKSIERIAKEGRKYGISLMIVSQRPSEVSETIFSQCNNFVAMRLTNPTDQHYVRRLLPDDLSAITGSLPTLEQREAIIIGDAVPLPSVIRVDEIDAKPNSHDINFHQEWHEDWRDAAFEEIVRRWTERIEP